MAPKGKGLKWSTIIGDSFTLYPSTRMKRPVPRHFHGDQNRSNCHARHWLLSTPLVLSQDGSPPTTCEDDREKLSCPTSYIGGIYLGLFQMDPLLMLNHTCLTEEDWDAPLHAGGEMCDILSHRLYFHAPLFLPPSACFLN